MKGESCSIVLFFSGSWFEGSTLRVSSQDHAARKLLSAPSTLFPASHLKMLEIVAVFDLHADGASVVASDDAGRREVATSVEFSGDGTHRGTCLLGVGASRCSCNELSVK